MAMDLFLPQPLSCSQSLYSSGLQLTPNWHILLLYFVLGYCVFAVLPSPPFSPYPSSFTSFLPLPFLLHLLSPLTLPPSPPFSPYHRFLHLLSPLTLPPSPPFSPYPPSFTSFLPLPSLLHLLSPLTLPPSPPFSPPSFTSFLPLPPLPSPPFSPYHRFLHLLSPLTLPLLGTHLDMFNEPIGHHLLLTTLLTTLLLLLTLLTDIISH